MLASDPVPAAREAFSGGGSLRAVADNREVVAHGDLLVLAVKPQSMKALMEEIRPHVTDRHLVVSIAAGVSLRQLAEGLGAKRRLVRVMPNTPCLVGASASAYTPGEAATADDAALVERLLKAVGVAFRVPESLLDAVTGLSGSGPAFVYLMIEALSDGGVRVGLPRDAATALAAQTVLGAAKMVLETGFASGRAQGSGGQSRRHDHRRAARPGARRRARGDHGRRGGGDAAGGGVGEELMADQTPGKRLQRSCAASKASIKDAPLEPGSPSWDEFLHLTWEEVEERARRDEPGFRTIQKLLKRRRFNK